MKKATLSVILLLLISCAEKEPLDQVIDEVIRINGKPSETQLLPKGVQWRKFRLTTANAVAQENETKKVIDKTLRLTGISTGNGYRWDTPKFKIEFELHLGRQSEPAKLLLWTTKK